MSIKDDSQKRQLLDLEIKSTLFDIAWLQDEIELKRNYLAILRQTRKDRRLVKETKQQ